MPAQRLAVGRRCTAPPSALMVVGRAPSPLGETLGDLPRSSPFDDCSTFLRRGFLGFFTCCTRFWLAIVAIVASLAPETVSSLKRMVGAPVEPVERQIVPDGVDALAASRRGCRPRSPPAPGRVSSPFSIHRPLAPREYSPVTRLAPWPSMAVT